MLLESWTLKKIKDPLWNMKLPNTSQYPNAQVFNINVWKRSWLQKYK